MNRTVLLVLACAAAAAVVADVVRPPVPPRPETESTASSSGVLSCPMMRTGASSGRLVLASRGPSSVRTTFFPKRGRPMNRTLSMKPGSTRALAVPKGLKGDVSAVVRYTGGPVAAAHTLLVRRDRDGAGGHAAAACSRASASTVAVTHLRTLRASSVLSIFNPSTGRATVKVVLHADGKPLLFQRLTRGDLGVDIAGGSRIDFRLGDFAFDAKRLTAVVTAITGRVVAEALVRSPSGAALVSATPAVGSFAAASARSGKGSSFAVGLVGDEDAGLDARFMSTTEQGRAGRLPESLAPAGTARIAIPERNEGGPVGYGLDLTIGSPVVGATGWQRTRGGRTEQAIAEAVPPARRWLVVASGRQGATVRALVVNPGPRTASLTVRHLGGQTRTRELEPGRIVALTIGKGSGVFAVDVSSTQPIAAFADGSGATRAGAWTYGYPGTPERPGRPISVGADPRVGVPGSRSDEDR